MLLWNVGSCRLLPVPFALAVSSLPPRTYNNYLVRIYQKQALKAAATTVRQP